jgi:4-aminobutyrate aminotransferase/(S)-3-amino-2-methylpropionate transaminase
MNEEEYIDYCCSQFDQQMISQVDPGSVAAIIIEPVQGEGGFIPMPKKFLEKLRTTCDANGIVLIFDEIQCGAARTGKFFACEHSGVIPDLICMAKSIGAGMPVSAVTGKAEIIDAPHLGGVGGTYGGNPLACVAAIEAVKILSSKEFLKRVNEVGELIRSTLESWKSKYKLIGDVRGVGAMRLVEFVKDRKTREPDADFTLEIIRDAISHGIILSRAGLFSNCIRLLPPIVMTDEQLKEGLSVLEDAIKRAHEKRKTD